MGEVMLLMVLLQALILEVGVVGVLGVGVVSCCDDGYRRDVRDCLHDYAGCG